MFVMACDFSSDSGVDGTVQPDDMGVDILPTISDGSWSQDRNSDGATKGDNAMDITPPDVSMTAPDTIAMDMTSDAPLNDLSPSPPDQPGASIDASPDFSLTAPPLCKHKMNYKTSCGGNIQGVWQISSACIKNDNFIIKAIKNTYPKIYLVHKDATFTKGEFDFYKGLFCGIPVMFLSYEYKGEVKLRLQIPRKKNKIKSCSTVPQNLQAILGNQYTVNCSTFLNFCDCTVILKINSKQGFNMEDLNVGGGAITGAGGVQAAYCVKGSSLILQTMGNGNPQLHPPKDLIMIHK